MHLLPCHIIKAIYEQLPQFIVDLFLEWGKTGEYKVRQVIEDWYEIVGFDKGVRFYTDLFVVHEHTKITMTTNDFMEKYGHLWLATDLEITTKHLEDIFEEVFQQSITFDSVDNGIHTINEHCPRGVCFEEREENELGFYPIHTRLPN